MSCVFAIRAKSNYLLSLCAAALLALLPVTTTNAGSLIHATLRDVAITIFDQYNTGHPIAIGQITAIGGQTLPKPYCLLIVAGTHLPTSPEGWRDLMDFFVAGPAQDVIVGSGGIPGVGNIPGTTRGMDNFGAAIIAALQAEKSRCPKGSNLVVFAHSLGCMEVQRLLTGYLKDNYKLKEAEFFGCPELKALPEEARKVIQFVVAKGDVIPYSGNLPLASDWRFPQHPTIIPSAPASPSAPSTLLGTSPSASTSGAPAALGPGFFPVAPPAGTSSTPSSTTTPSYSRASPSSPPLAGTSSTATTPSSSLGSQPSGSGTLGTSPLSLNPSQTPNSASDAAHSLSSQPSASGMGTQILPGSTLGSALGVASNPVGSASSALSAAAQAIGQQIKNHTEAYIGAPLNYPATSTGTSISVNLDDLRGYPAIPFAFADRTDEAEQSFQLNVSGMLVNAQQDRNSRMPAIPKVSH